MYHYSYAEHAQEDSSACRLRERKALDRSIQLLEQGIQKGAESSECLEGLSSLIELWDVLISDLISPYNDLPDTLRADLISVGFWIVKEADLVRRKRSDNLLGLIEVCTSISNGLK